MWLIIKYTLPGKIGAFLIGAAPIMLAVEMKSHVDALISAITPTLTIIAGIIALKKGQKDLVISLKELHVTLDGKMERLLDVTAKEAHAAGKTEEREDERSRVLEDKPKTVIIGNTKEDPAKTEVMSDPSRPVHTLDQQQRNIDKAQARLDKDVKEESENK